MTLLTSYQDSVLRSLKKYDFQRILKMKGKCHDALIGEWINWWLEQDIDGMIFNPARGSRSRSGRCIADLLFLEQFGESQSYEVKGVAEVENREKKFMDKIESLASYENYSKQGCNVYPNLEFAILCYTLDVPNEEMALKIYNTIDQISESSGLLWIVCEIGRSLSSRQTADYSIYMPNYIKGSEDFFYYRNFSSVILYSIKNAKQIQNIHVPGVEE